MAVSIGNRNYGGIVFGTFNVRYDQTEFERKNEDGTFVIGLNPECRVFIFGTEVTKDVKSVSIDRGLEGSTCTIELANPRGKYVISKSDLMKKWREDKDILAAYTYGEYGRVDRSLIAQLSNALLGPRGTAEAQYAMSLLKELKQSIPGRIPSVQTSTRMIFEVKHFSGHTKSSGDVVFDYRDPVYVFLKGRFSPYWYFGFSGLIVGFDEAYTFGSEESLTIKCEDITVLWKKAKLTERGAFFNFSRLETRYRNNQRSAVSRFMRPEDAYNLSEFVKVLLTTMDYGRNTVNCHISSNGDDLTHPDKYQEALDKMFTQAKIGQYFMLTDSGGGISVYGNKYKVNISDIKYTVMNGSLNDLKFSPGAPAYIQFNEFKFRVYDTKYFNNYLNTSVRFWECDHRINENFVSGSIGSGWKDNLAFGICGIHPAMPYEFVNNFEILSNIWEQCYICSQDAIDRLHVSPREKIMESVAGSPMEVSRNNSELSIIVGTGTNANLFRPRVFLFLPERYAGGTRVGRSGRFVALGTLNVEENNNVLEYIREQLKAIEYIVYTSPAGDVFVSPENYDFHPLDHCTIIDGRGIVLKSDDVKFRVERYTEPGIIYERRDKAYFFNSEANHPFFIMNKDLVRYTQTFRHEMIHTSLRVQGGQNAIGGVFHLQSTNLFNFLGDMARSTRYSSENPFAHGAYVADGFPISLHVYEKRISDQLNAEKSDVREKLLRRVFENLLQNDLNTKLINLLERFYEVLKDWSIPVEYDLFIGSAIDKISNLPEKMEDQDLIEIINLFPLDFWGKNKLTFFRALTVREIFSDHFKISRINRNRIGVAVSELLNKTKSETFDRVIRHQNRYVDSFAYTLFYLYLPISVKIDVESATYYTRYLDYLAKLSMPLIIVNNATLKEMERQGRYNPRLDFERWYGYNPASDVVNHYIRNGIEANEYAKIALMRLASKAYEISFTTVGRPEALINYTYFFEKKDYIGLLTRSVLSYSFGGDFELTGTLSYIRKNAITYAYSNDNLDLLRGQKDNSYFKKEADKYYRWNTLLRGISREAVNYVRDRVAEHFMRNTIITNTGQPPSQTGASPESAEDKNAKRSAKPLPLRGIGWYKDLLVDKLSEHFVQHKTEAARKTKELIRKLEDKFYLRYPPFAIMGGEVAGKFVSGLFRSMMPIGGIFVAHDFIGHMEYDRRGFAVELDRTSSELSRVTFSENSMIYILITEIQQHLNNVAPLLRSKGEFETRIRNFETFIRDTELTRRYAVQAIESRAYGPGERSEYDQLRRDIERYDAEIVNAISQLVTLRSQLNGVKEQISIIFRRLYGEVFNGEKPDDVTEWVRAFYCQIASVPQSSQSNTGSGSTANKGSSRYADQVSKTLEEALYPGLFTRLFYEHMITFGGNPFDWEIDESASTNVDMVGGNSVRYFIRRCRK